MLTKIYILLGLLAIPSSTFSMEFLSKKLKGVTSISKHKSKPEIKADICHLLLLPEDIQNLIAQYLVLRDIETDTEFIERTNEILKTRTDNKVENNTAILELKRSFNIFLDHAETLTVYNKKSNKEKGLFSHRLPLIASYPMENFLFAFSPNGSKVIFYREFPTQDGNRAGLGVCDLVMDRSEKFINYTNDGTKGIALSFRNKLARVFDKYNRVTHNTVPCLEIKSLAGTEKSIELPFVLAKSGFVAFNKQGTKIRVDYFGDKPLIIPLCSPEEHHKQSQKRLIDFFRQKGVCKVITQK